MKRTEWSEPLREARHHLARLIAARSESMGPEGRIRAAYEAGRARYLSHGKMIKGDEAVRLRLTREELRAFVCGFETLRVAVERTGGHLMPPGSRRRKSN